MASRDKRDHGLQPDTRRANRSRAEGGGRRQRMLDSTQPQSPSPGALYRQDVALSDLKPGECGSVMRLNGNFCGRLRLLEMGLTPGTHVRMVRAAAFGGPVDIEVRGYQLSLRREEAAAVWLGDEDQP
jgi:ferrous iron transport protein A